MLPALVLLVFAGHVVGQAEVAQNLIVHHRPMVYQRHLLQLLVAWLRKSDDIAGCVVLGDQLGGKFQPLNTTPAYLT